MRTLKLRVRRWGDGLAVLIPERVAREEGIGDGDTLDVALTKERRVSP